MTGLVAFGVVLLAGSAPAAADALCPAVTVGCTGADSGHNATTGFERRPGNWAVGLTDDPTVFDLDPTLDREIIRDNVGDGFGMDSALPDDAETTLDEPGLDRQTGPEIPAEGFSDDTGPDDTGSPDTVPIPDASTPGNTAPDDGFFDPLIDRLSDRGIEIAGTDIETDRPDDVASADESVDELPLAEARDIYDAFRSPSLISLRSRQDLTDDPVVDDVPADDVSKLTAGRTVLIIDALAEVGAFRRNGNPTTTSTIRTIRDGIPSDGLSADGYRAEIRRFSEDLQPALDILEADGVNVSPALELMASSLSPEIMAALDAGETALVDPEPWLNGLADLIVRDGEASVLPANRSGDRAAVIAVVAAVAGIEFDRAFPEAVDGGSADPVATSGGAGDSILATVLIATIVALVVALAVVRKRSIPAPAAAAEERPPKLSITDLLDASRRMSESLDPDEIGTIVMAETKRLVAAEGCIIALREGKGLRAMHHEPAELFQPDVLLDPEAAESCLRRVVETGQATVMVVSDEPVLVEVPMALIAVPIVVDGSVAGAVMIVRVSARPFDRDDVEAMEMLAPMLGTALRSAAAHGSATALAETEPLTGLKNRRRLEQDLASLGDGDKVSYIMIDVDHFKNFNDINGHAAGDEALRRVARVLEASVRPGDLVYRYGGEEFCMLLPDVTRADALRVAERVRVAVESAEIAGGEAQPTGTVTVSVGIACDGPPEALVERADTALYEAKREGRNQVRVAEPA